MADKDLIRAQSVVKILGDRVILYDVNLDVREGEIFGVIGPSGSGKTTLLRLLIGFFKPEKGDILIRSRYIKGHQHELYTSVSRHTDAVKRIFGFASQHPSIYMNLTAQENLEYFAALQGIPKAAAERTADILLQLMDLTEARNTLGENLSGGMQRRLDLACAMVHRPRVLILDEPTADLDPFLRKHIWDIIRKINKQGTTVIVSSHLLADVETLCDRVAIVHHGKLLGVDTPDNIKKQYIKTETIFLQTYPGKYDKLIPKLTHNSITEVTQDGQSLIVTAKDVEKALGHILSSARSAKESVTDLRVAGASLDEVFLRLGEEDSR